MIGVNNLVCGEEIQSILEAIVELVIEIRRLAPGARSRSSLSRLSGPSSAIATTIEEDLTRLWRKFRTRSAWSNRRDWSPLGAEAHCYESDAVHFTRAGYQRLTAATARALADRRGARCFGSFMAHDSDPAKPLSVSRRPRIAETTDWRWGDCRCGTGAAGVPHFVANRHKVWGSNCNLRCIYTTGNCKRRRAMPTGVKMDAAFAFRCSDRIPPRSEVIGRATSGDSGQRLQGALQVERSDLDRHGGQWDAHVMDGRGDQTSQDASASGKKRQGDRRGARRAVAQRGHRQGQPGRIKSSGGSIGGADRQRAPSSPRATAPCERGPGSLPHGEPDPRAPSRAEETAVDVRRRGGRRDAQAGPRGSRRSRLPMADWRSDERGIGLLRSPSGAGPSDCAGHCRLAYQPPKGMRHSSALVQLPVLRAEGGASILAFPLPTADPILSASAGDEAMRA